MQVCVCVLSPYRNYIRDRQAGYWQVYHGVIDKKLGSGPNDPATFGVSQLIALPLQPGVP